jgi:hypothetical protein
MNRNRPAFREAAAVPLVAIVYVLLGPGAAPPARAAAEGWPEITAEERRLTKPPQDPEADAVVLINERNGKIVRKADDWVNVLDYHWRMKILTERGKRFADVRIPAQKYSRVSNIRARTVKADGSIVPVPPDQIFEKVVLQAGNFKLTERVFSFPAVEPGAIIEYRYDRHDNILVFVDPFYFEGPELTLRARVTQAIPIEAGYLALPDLCEVQPSVADWREGKMKGKMFSLELRNLPGYRDEALMPPRREVSPRLDMVLKTFKNVYWSRLGRRDLLFSDWPAVAKYVDADYQKTVKDGQGAIKPVVESWLQGVSDAEERIRAIVLRVQNDFGYIPYTTVIGLTRKIEDVLKEKNADNEEKAVLLLAALRAIGVEAHPVLVSGRDAGAVNPNFFNPSQFTHVIVALPHSSGITRWIDPTVSYSPFGFMPWQNAGAGALLIKDGQGELIDLPQKNELSVSRFKTTVRPRPDGRADIETEAEFLGEDAIDLRRDLVPAAESARLAFLQKWVADRRGGAALRSHVLENLEDVEKPLRMKLVFEAPGLVTVADDLLLVRGCVLTCEDGNPVSRRARRHPFYVDRGWNEEETVLIQAPQGLQAQAVPAGASARSEVATLTFSCMSQGDGARCSRQFVARRNRWPATVQENLRKMYDRVLEVDRSTVALQRTEGAAAGGR